jgi:hypothetical protein
MTDNIRPETSGGRRSFLIGCGAAAAGVVAVAIPAIGKAQPVRPQVVEVFSVSSMTQDLISDFVQTSIRLNAADMEGDPEAYRSISDARSKALVSLTFHQPGNLVELSAKTAALVEFSEDTERFSLRVLVEDTNRLAQVAK